MEYHHGSWLLIALTTSFIVTVSQGNNQQILLPQNPVYNNQITCVANTYLRCYLSESYTVLWENKNISDPRGLILIDDKLILSHSDQTLIYDARLGHRLASYPSDAPVFDPVVIAGKLIISGHGGLITAVDISRNVTLWQRQLDDQWVYPPAVSENQLVSGGKSGILWSIDPLDGSTQWQIDIGQELVYRPVYSGGRFIVSSFDGKLRALDPQDGKILWTSSFDSPMIDMRTAGPNKILASGYDGKLRAIDPSTGRVSWNTRVYSSARFHYTTNNQRIASISHTGLFHLLDSKNGHILYQSNIEGNHQVPPLITPSGIWLFPRNRPVSLLKPPIQGFL